METQSCTVVKPRGAWCICCFTELWTMDLRALLDKGKGKTQPKAEHRVLCEDRGPSHPME